MDRRLATAIVAILVVAVLAGVTAYREKRGEETALVLTTFPGIDGDLRMILEGCTGVEVKSLAPPGSDPHSYNLMPQDVELIRKAVLIVSTGHAPFEERVREYAPDKTVVIPEIPGIRLGRLPGGAVNLHMPIYDPDNYLVFVRYISDRLANAFPQCNSTILKNEKFIERKIANIKSRYEGILSGYQAVAASPLAQYAVTWLGADIRVYLASSHGSQASPEQARMARDILKRGGIAIVIVDSRGRPLGDASTYLLELAEQSGARVIRVEAPFTPTPILQKIEQVAFEATKISGG